ncbi:hemicentin-2-like [Ixodes scapularis]|uniref:hemicentin-2-like n=1 Tax=Ixodes scapularis TaxID=6945 RepID=UPI001A9CFAD9|nr:hemicentin-2-like [Ixodes scapularis]
MAEDPVYSGFNVLALEAPGKCKNAPGGRAVGVVLSASSYGFLGVGVNVHRLHGWVQALGNVFQGVKDRLGYGFLGRFSDFDLSWHWNSTVLPGKRHIDMKTGVVRSQLNHRNISRSDLNADVTCTASNSFGDDFKRTLKLDVWTKPTDIRIRPRPFNEDAAASVECEVLGSRPSPLVTWYLGDHGPLDASFTHDQTDDAVTTSVLTFTAQAGDSGKTLMCVAEHRIIDYKINTSFVVEVQYEPKVVLSLNASRPGAGEDVYLECEIQANPMATHVHWYLNSDPIAAFPLDVYQHTVTLRKTQVTPRDSGDYQCAALSSYGVGRSNVVNIYINDCAKNLC